VDLALNSNGNGNGNGDHAAIVSLDDLALYPERAHSLSGRQLAALAGRIAALQSMIASLQFTAALALDSIPLQGHAAADDARTVPLETVMRDLGVSRRWLFSHADRPGYRWIVRVSRKRLAILEAGYHRYLTSRPR